MAYNPSLPAGAAVAASSAPVAVAIDQINDVLITGAAGQSTLGNNILLATAGAGAIDCMAYSPTLRTFAAQIISTAGITAGAIIFEESNDGVTWVVAPWVDDASPGSLLLSTATNIAASQNKFFTGRIARRYFRCRISTAFSGGTVQAITKFSANDFPRQMPVTSANSSYLSGTMFIDPSSRGTLYSALTTAGTNAALIISGSRCVTTVAIYNPTSTPAFVKFYNKATAPTPGTDVPVLTYPIPANSTVTDGFTYGLRGFPLGIGIAVTGAMADSDTSNAPAGIRVNAQYTF
jgi:hypothetical protein